MSEADVTVLEGRVLSEVAFGLGGLHLRFWGQGVANSTRGEDMDLRVEGRIELVVDGARSSGEATTLDPAWFLLVRRKVIRATRTDSEGLVLTFADGSSFEVRPNPSYESWSFWLGKDEIDFG